MKPLKRTEAPEVCRDGADQAGSGVEARPSSESQISAIEAIHRQPDGVITFHQKTGEDFKNLVGVRAADLRELWPTLHIHGKSDVFMSLNAFWDVESKEKRLSAKHCRKSDRLRYLCACFADLNCYKSGFAPRDMVGRIVEMEEAETLPPTSIIVESGRGIWLMWLLRDADNPQQAQRAWPEKVEAYARIQDKINRTLATFGADAKDAVRVLRVPGSLNSKTLAEVKYLPRLNSEGNIHSYTIAELSARFGVRPLQEARRKEPPRPHTLRSRGPSALTRYRMEDFRKLMQLRGGRFNDGCRNRAALIYAWLLKCSRVPIQRAEELVLDLGKNCRPPLSKAECRGTLASGYNRKWKSYIAKTNAPPSIRYQTISDWLDITPSEAECLQKYPPATRFACSDARSAPPRTRSAEREARRKTILRLIAESNSVPPLRRMQELLKAAGHATSHTTVKADYRALKVRTKAAGA